LAGKWYIFLVVLLPAVPSAVWAEQLSVPSDSYETIQSAIESANPGDEVVVAPGLYTENLNFRGKAITVRSEDPDDPNVVAATVLDGSAPADPNFGSVVIFNSGEGHDSILEGFTITGGTGSWLVISWDLHEPYWNRCGGGVLCYNMSEPTIRKNVFQGNTAGQGGGIYIYGDPVNFQYPEDPNEHLHLTPMIIGNTFVNNSAIIEHGFSPPDDNYPLHDNGDGGAIVGFQGVDAIITNNIITSNHADFYGGGIHLRQWSHGKIVQNHIRDNDSMLGAGIHITYKSKGLIAKNLIENNSATSLGGGGIYVYYLSAPLIEKNRVTNNSSVNGAGIAVKYSSFPEVRNNLVDNNKEGSGITSTGSSPWIHHNTVLNNAGVSWGGGIECGGTLGEVIVENNIVAMTSNGYGIYVSSALNPTIRYNNVWHNALGDYGPDYSNQTGSNGNISLDPRVLCESGECVRLNYDSPCMGAGDPNYIAFPDETDYQGDPRIIRMRTDIGADEAYPVWNLTTQQQYVSIQQAIDSAVTEDTIVVSPGTYLECIDFKGINITLQSADPGNREIIEKTIIDGDGADSAVLTFTGTETPDCLLNGFTIIGAEHSGNGGGIQGNNATVTIKNCIITGNQANQGAGIYSVNGTIQNCLITDNHAESHGGGIGQGDADIVNCVIIANSAAANGGGIYNCNAIIVNNTVAKNSAGAAGGGMYACNGTIVNSIVWDNYAGSDPALAVSAEPNYSCIQGGDLGQSNIDDDPIFVDPNTDNYHLTIYSPCINAGNNDLVPETLSLDMDGETRIFSFEPNGIPIVDMGADEVFTSTADINKNGMVELVDLNILASEWLAEGESLEADIFPDEIVNMYDYAALANRWLWQGHWYAEPESALEFTSGSGGYVEVYTPQGCILNNVYRFTYTAWIYPLSFSQNLARIIGKNERAMMTSCSGVLAGYSNGGGSAFSYSMPGSLQVNKWQFVSMTYDYYTGDRKINLYVNGREVEYQAHSVGLDIKPPDPDWRTEGEWDLRIGTAAWAPGSYVPHAIIDEVVIFDRILSVQEIAYLYNHGFGRPTPISMNPIGLWHMDEGQGDTVRDSSGNGNHGVLSEINGSKPIWADGKF